MLNRGYRQRIPIVSATTLDEVNGNHEQDAGAHVLAEIGRRYDAGAFHPQQTRCRRRLSPLQW